MRKTRSQTQAESGQPSANGSLPQRSAGLRAPAIPADYNELRNKIVYFRVFELQKILTALNVSHIGRKTELQTRLNDLLTTNYIEVAAKIREVYKSCSQEDRNNQEFGGPDPKRMYQPQILPVQSDIRATIVGNNIMVPYSTHMTSGYPIHPDVRLKKLAFYDVLATLLQPATLVPNSAQRMQEASYYFTLTPQQATEIASNRDIRCGSKIEHIIQVQLRFCLLETSCEQDDCFPPNVILKVNNKLCPLPNPIPTNRPNVEPKRPPRPVNVTSNVKLSPTVTNGITVQWCADSPRGYVIAAYLVRKLTSAQLLHRMKTKGVKPADYTRSLIKEKLNEDADCEIATTMLKVSLICPLGKMRMTIPCRASTCSHLQCFDASLYLQMNERKPTWNCPVCDKAAVYETLVIDGYFQEVLASPMLTSDDNEIQLHKDGSWSTQIMRNDTQILDTPNKQVQKVEVISDDLEVITTEVEEKPVTPAPPSLTVQPVTNNNEPTSTTTNDTVDLTLSDSDDDLPLKRRAAARANANNANGNGQKAGPLPTKVKQNGGLDGTDMFVVNNSSEIILFDNNVQKQLQRILSEDTSTIYEIKYDCHLSEQCQTSLDIEQKPEDRFNSIDETSCQLNSPMGTKEMHITDSFDKYNLLEPINYDASTEFQCQCSHHNCDCELKYSECSLGYKDITDLQRDTPRCKKQPKRKKGKRGNQSNLSINERLARRRALRAARTRKHRMNMSPEESQRRRDMEAARQRLKRATYTAEKMERIRIAHAERARIRRANTSAEVLSAQRARDAARRREIRARLNPEKAAEIRANDAARKRYTRAMSRAL